MTALKHLKSVRTTPIIWFASYSLITSFSFDKKYDCMHYIFLCLKRHFLALKRSVRLAYRISISLQTLLDLRVVIAWLVIGSARENLPTNHNPANPEAETCKSLRWLFAGYQPDPVFSFRFFFTKNRIISMNLLMSFASKKRMTSADIVRQDLQIRPRKIKSKLLYFLMRF